MINIKSWFKSSKVKIAVLVISALIVGYVVGGRGEKSTPAGSQIESQQVKSVKQTIWTCSMHPQIRMPKPGKCPLCGMTLIPVEGADVTGSEQERILVVSEAAQKLMDIQTTQVERKFVTAEIRMVGKIDYDETRVKYITAWVPGRIDQLYVDYTGVTVNQGDHMVYLYSPQLLSAQAELLQAVKAVKNVGGSELIRRSTLATLEAARGKLRLLGLKKQQITEIEKTGEPVDHHTIYAPIGGVVIHKNATEGMYVQTGTKIYTIADLSKLWVKLDAYESDVMWVRYGQEVEFETEAYPGEVFKSTISFIDPVLNPKTRTLKLRVNVENTDGKLKPEMFVRAVVRAKVAQGGQVMDEAMAGKWVCPMHPDVIKDNPGTCDICDMNLVTTESKGYVKASDAGEPPLVVPVSAALVTGKRAVVYVKLPGTDKPTFEGREVVLGPRAGDYYIVNSGLAKGEIVVTNGNFKIDSALQIQAKPSMMSAEAEEPIADHQQHETIEVPEEFSRQFREMIEGYLTLQRALAADKSSEAAKSAGQISKSLSAIDMSLLSNQAHRIWMQSGSRITESLKSIEKTESIEQIREAFKNLSDELITVIRQFQPVGSGTLYRFNCAMAFDNRGADWLQKDEGAKNPYLGTSMLKCGEIIEVIGGKNDGD